MRKKKSVIVMGISICIFLFAAGMFLLKQKDAVGSNENKTNRVSFVQAKEQFASDIKELKEGKYENLIAKDFTASIEDAEGLYHFQILRNQNLETTSENVDEMLSALQLFFGEGLDKSQLLHYAYPLDENGEIPKDDITVMLGYEEVMSLLKEEKNQAYALFGGFILEGDMYAHLNPAFDNVWFSKRSLGTSLPGDAEHTKEYLYVTGIRQTDTIVTLQDRAYQLSELEESVLNYVNGEAFPLPQNSEISYKIGTVHIITIEGQECINFVLRRVYKGVPFEYGYEAATGEYVDELEHDYTRVNYIEGTQPDTIMGFMDLKGTIEKLGEITKIITAGEALNILSQQIGENSVYEVYGVELVYRSCEVPEEKSTEISTILEPKWKIITVNQNDDKYTLFYVDVVTGKITERFEYYYD